MEKRDYYEILGISKSASPEEIKSAYRKLAREHHPDMVKDGDKAAAEKRFKEINEAYQILSEPDKRKMYDQFGHEGAKYRNTGQGFSGGGAGGPFSYTYTTGGAGFDGIDPFDIFEQFFGFRGFGGRRQNKGKNLYYELHVAFEDAVHGAKKDITTEAGKITIKIPQGARDGIELRFAGKGMPGPAKDIPNGDLFITLRIATPKIFQRAGDNLGTLLKIDFIQAILGDEVPVDVIDTSEKTGMGHVKLKIPAGTQNGAQFRLKNRGMPKLQGTGQGDLIVQVEVITPKKVSKKQKQLLEEYRKNS
ncbi:J domain-containing protein [Candidatus Nomurabacteria bacterium]|uniref:J domain-containing protein n=1 Tax=candidate division WWE3 bacterium TaxID=2053526 RepID=A0A955DZZ8_UNCKA|nr:J domain-containing protein [candidate division WWE3 bacterium]MCB9823818.1 J domain-containing protein [Candidatus Nomurabacteria bacterium]MCB9826776.1 J domain-containing protein [Candidatus Nomurabacteria bacterium]MCB9827613.1 J domain-containing protein [Candidatus Nomurabacteria bacterium]HXK52599.1 J domain-containing protein [bacterium]